MSNWRRRAKCVGHDPSMWFPDREGEAARLQYVEAKTICLECPVRPDCLDYAVRNHERYGMWGGLTPEERGVPADPDPGEASCLGCGAAITSQWGRKYCSHACYCENKLTVDASASRPADKECAVCKTMFAPLNAFHRYCSEQCSDSARRQRKAERRKTGFEHVPCAKCGAVFLKVASNRRFCSLECQVKFHSASRAKRKLSSA